MTVSFIQGTKALHGHTDFALTRAVMFAPLIASEFLSRQAIESQGKTPVPYSLHSIGRSKYATSK